MEVGREAETSSLDQSSDKSERDRAEPSRTPSGLWPLTPLVSYGTSAHTLTLLHPCVAVLNLDYSFGHNPN